MGSRKVTVGGMIVCLLAAGYPLAAQSLPARVARGAGRLARPAEMAVSSARMTSAVEAAAERALSARPAVTAQNGESPSYFSFPDVLSYGGRPYTRGGRTPWAPLPAEKTPWIKGLFRAYPKDDLTGHSFSGFVVKIPYQGTTEIFGVVAAHSISPDFTESALGQFFTARVLDGGLIKDIPAEIVQVSAPSMLDIALVKFRPEDEKIFEPFALALQEPEVGEILQGIGFSHNQVAFLPQRRLLENTLVSLRTDMLFSRIDRPGLCGSPVLNQAGEIVGIHTGSTRMEANPVNDKGFATKAVYLRALAEAYHRADGKATFPLILGENKIVELEVDEYVSAVRIMDGAGEIIWRRAVHAKFPYNDIMDVLPYGRYIELDISRVGWTGRFLMESPLNYRTVKYDLKKKKEVTSKSHRGFFR